MESFLYQVIVFIGAAIVLVPIFQSLGFGSVLGYLIAGIIIGPFGLKLIPDTESVMHLSELGVIFLLFIIGLEIETKKLWGMRRHLFGLGGLQILFTSIVFTLLGHLFGLSYTSAAVIGFALSLSSTAFAIQSLTEKNQFNTEFGRSSFAVLLMQDLTAIPALAIIPMLANQSASSGPLPWQRIGLAVGFIIFLVIVSRYLIRPVFRLIAATHSREIFTAVALFIVLSVAAVMDKLGLSAALGTFLAGVLLADSEYRHELETNLEPFKSLLLGLFFVAVGMGVSLTYIQEHFVYVAGCVALYLVIKSSVLYGVGRMFGLNHESAKQMTLTIGQGGEFAFVIFGIALTTGFIESDTLKFLTAIVTISMALSPLLSLINIKWAAMHRKMIQPEYDQIQGEAPEVIIAGFGRFGQVFGRVLKAQGIPFVAIDHDPDQIELVRKFGNKVYYGDVSRQDLLEAAGIARAKYFILAIDDVKVSIETARVIRESFPHIQLFARARNRGHAFDLMDLNVPFIKREVFDSSVYFVEELLVAMGFEKEKASVLVQRFKRHDELMVQEQYKVRADDNALISVSKQSVLQLAQVFHEDSTKSYVDSDTQMKT